MNAIDFIKRDHQKFREMFAKYESAAESNGDNSAIERITSELFAELKAHEGMEEDVFFPALEKHVSDEGEFEIKEGIQEHHVADLLIDELRHMSVDDEEFAPKFQVLKENVEHHLDEEEEEILPRAERLFSSEELTALGDEMEKVKERLLETESAS